MNKWIFLVISLSCHLAIKAQISDFKHINFENADKIANSYRSHDLNNLPQLSYNLTHNLLSDVEKFRAIYAWVCTNIQSDYKGFRKNHTKRSKFQNDSLELRKWNESFSKEVFKKLADEKKTICTGYAYLVKNLANLANIKCEIIDGYGRNENSVESKLKFPNHSWNAVQLNNKWYLCDATWSSGTYDLNSNTFEYKYNIGYFLADPELFAKDHFPNDHSWFLVQEKPMLSEFLESPLVYGDAYNYGVFPIEPSRMHLEVVRDKDVTFLVKNIKDTDITTVFLQIVTRNSIQFIKPKVERLKNDVIQIKYPFNSLGFHDVHIKVNNYPICTYVIKVKKGT